MQHDRLQPQRFEFKYVIPNELALAIRDFVASYLDLDEYGAKQPDFSYPVHSLYLDSDDFALQQSTINGDKNRFKLRIRFYENRPQAPVYFEIKRRSNNTISKERAAVHREAVDLVLAGQLPDSSRMASDDPRHIVALQHFVEHVVNLGAKPRAHVAYRREAWLPADDNSVRVTFDREVRSCPELTTRLVAEMDNPVFVFGDNVVLELKFTNRFPDWLGDLVRVFGLTRSSAAKYVDGMLLMGENGSMNRSYHMVDPNFTREKLRKVRVSGAGFKQFIPTVVKQ